MVIHSERCLNTKTINGVHMLLDLTLASDFLDSQAVRGPGSSQDSQ